MRTSPYDQEDAKHLIAEALALRAAVEAEEFDRTLPGQWYRKSDEWMPDPGQPSRLSYQNARRLNRVVGLAANLLELETVPRGFELRQSHAAAKSELELYQKQDWWPKLEEAWAEAVRRVGAA